MMLAATCICYLVSACRCDYALEARNIQDFYNNFRGDPKVKIPWVRGDLTGRTCLIMEWIDGIRCTDPAAIHAAPSINVQARTALLPTVC